MPVKLRDGRPAHLTVGRDVTEGLRSEECGSAAIAGTPVRQGCGSKPIRRGELEAMLSHRLPPLPGVLSDRAAKPVAKPGSQ